MQNYFDTAVMQNAKRDGYLRAQILVLRTVWLLHVEEMPLQLTSLLSTLLCVNEILLMPESPVENWEILVHLFY